MEILRSDIRNFESGLYELKESIRFFNGKSERCVLHGIIDLTHKIESNIEKLDSEMSRIDSLSKTPVDEIRNIRLHDHLEDLKKQYNNIKAEFERECFCTRR